MSGRGQMRIPLQRAQSTLREVAPLSCVRCQLMPCSILCCQYTVLPS